MLIKAEQIKSIFLNKKFLLILFIIFIFLGVALYTYNNYIAPKINPDFVPNREFETEGEDCENKFVDIYLFSVEWCQHSNDAKPIWNKIKKVFKGKNPSGSKYEIRFIELDGDKNEAEIDSFEAEYLTPNNKKIDGYPSIWMVKDKDVYEFAATPTKDNLVEFITSLV